MQISFWILRLCTMCHRRKEPAVWKSSLLMLYMHPKDLSCIPCGKAALQGNLEVLCNALKVLVHRCTSCWVCVEGLCKLWSIMMGCSCFYVQD